MKEIVNRLTENRQIETAKSILESNGYKVSKKSRIERIRTNPVPYESWTLSDFEDTLSLMEEEIDDLIRYLEDDCRDYDEAMSLIEDAKERTADICLYEEFVEDDEVLQQIEDLSMKIHSLDHLEFSNIPDDPWNGSGLSQKDFLM